MNDNPLLESDEAILRRQLRAVFRQDAISSTMLTHIFEVCLKPECAKDDSSALWVWSERPVTFRGFSLKELGLQWVGLSDYMQSVGETRRPCYVVKHREKLIAKVIELFKPEYASILELEFGAVSLIKSGV